jgi:hypothetical protein
MSVTQQMGVFDQPAGGLKASINIVHNHSSPDKSNDYLTHRMPGSNGETLAAIEEGW